MLHLRPVAPVVIATALVVSGCTASVGGTPARPAPASAPRSGPRSGAPSSAPSGPVGAPGPVVLVPGYGGATAALRPLAADLARAGRAVTVMHLPGDGTGDLRRQARVLAWTVDRVLRRSGAHSVDVVGYSAGGVVARLWARDDGGAVLARRIVTLGSPHHGTAVAGLARALVPGRCPIACRQLAPGSAVLRTLNRGDETPDGPAWVSLWSTADVVVDPPSSARLDGAIDLTVQQFCPRDEVTHTGLPGDRAVRSVVRAELTAGPATADPAVSCP